MVPTWVGLLGLGAIAVGAGIHFNKLNFGSFVKNTWKKTWGKLSIGNALAVPSIVAAVSIKKHQERIENLHKFENYKE